MKAAGFPFLASEDVADAVRYVLSTPSHVQVVKKNVFYRVFKL